MQNRAYRPSIASKGLDRPGFPEAIFVEKYSNAVQNRLRELGGDAVVFTPGYFQDGAGRYVTPREAGTELLDAIKAVIEHERLSRM